LNQIGEVKRDGQNYYIWAACGLCGKERWTRSGVKKPIYAICKECQLRELHRQKKGTIRYGLAPCKICGGERRVQFVKGEPRHEVCKNCTAKIVGQNQCRENNWNWKGGQFYKNGYIFILQPSHPCATPNGYVKRARLVLERKLGRYLLPGMETHHINGIKDDDSPENLMEVTKREHGTLGGKIGRRTHYGISI
jgi:hypothetical protein